MKTKWKIHQPDKEIVKGLRSALKCSHITASILAGRGITTPEQARDFLNPAISRIRPPFDMKDMAAAAKRAALAITNNEQVLIFGDYDVDGVTSTTLLLEFFKYTRTNVSYYIPHRSDEGYGLQKNHVETFAKGGNKPHLIITVDCGSSSIEAIKAATAAGIDVIVTDHHKVPQIPECIAVVNPKRDDCNAGFDDLAGVGVAFYFAVTLRKELREQGYWKRKKEPNLKDYCDLVALGTLADMVPLTQENRIFTKTGMEVIHQGKRPGIQALINASGIKNGKLESDDIGFRLAPRLNAAGRLGHANTAVELLTAKNLEAASRVAHTLDSLNSERQQTEKLALEDVFDRIQRNPDLVDRKTIVLVGGDWHEGVIGIMAARIAKKFFRPTILISVNDGTGKGSGRSIQGFDLFKGLSTCSDDLEVFGGHAMAAGLTIKQENIDRFKENFEQSAASMTSSQDYVRTVSIDLELNFELINDNLINELETLAPFGTGNPEPLFLAANLKIIKSFIVGESHKRLVLKQPPTGKGAVMNAIHFNPPEDAYTAETINQIAYRLRWNRWMDKKTPQLVIAET